MGRLMHAPAHADARPPWTEPRSSCPICRARPYSPVHNNTPYRFGQRRHPGYWCRRGNNRKSIAGSRTSGECRPMSGDCGVCTCMPTRLKHREVLFMQQRTGACSRPHTAANKAESSWAAPSLSKGSAPRHDQACHSPPQAPWNRCCHRGRALGDSLPTSASCLPAIAGCAKFRPDAGVHRRSLQKYPPAPSCSTFAATAHRACHDNRRTG